MQASIDVRCHIKALKAIILTAAICTTSCAYRDLTDTCLFPSGAPFYEMEPSELTLVVSAPRFSEDEPPFLTLGGSNPELVVDLVAVEVSGDIVTGISGSNCAPSEVREFDLAVDAKEWLSHWAAAKEKGRFAMGVGVPSLEPPVRESSFGFALVEKSSRESAASCGCLST